MGNLFKVVVVAVLAFGGWRYFSAEKAPARIASADIEIYTTHGCTECRRAKEYMNARNIPYLEKDVEGDMELRKELRARGGYGVPYFFIHGKPLLGFDERSFESARREGG